MVGGAVVGTGEPQAILAEREILGAECATLFGGHRVSHQLGMAVAGDGRVMSHLTTAGDLVEDELFGEGVVALGLDCQQVGDGGNIGGGEGIGLNRFDDQLRLSPRSPATAAIVFPCPAA